jgi:hypothetical protein
MHAVMNPNQTRVCLIRKQEHGKVIEVPVGSKFKIDSYDDV